MVIQVNVKNKFKNKKGYISYTGYIVHDNYTGYAS